MNKTPTSLLLTLLLLASSGCEVAPPESAARPSDVELDGAPSGLFVGLLAPGPSSVHPSDIPTDGPCTCATNQASVGWCGPCSVGYVNGIQVASASLFDAIDPHGHVIDPASIACSRCRDAMLDDGFCDDCGSGYVGGELFFSPLTWSMAKADAASDSHRGCATTAVWCDEHRMGSIASLTWHDQTLFELASTEHARLRAATERLDECQHCAIALMLRSRCHTCGLSWEHDEPPLQPRTLTMSRKGSES